MPVRTAAIYAQGCQLGLRAMSARPRLTARRMSAAAAGAGLIAAGAFLERRHLRMVASDPDYARLTAPLGGRPIAVVSADGTELHAEAFGAPDAHTVVLAHGWTERLSFWGPVITRLMGRGQRVVAYDLRGHGRSGPAVENDYTLDRFGEDVEAVLEAAVSADCPHPRATVVGHSLGAMSIVAWAGARMTIRYAAFAPSAAEGDVAFDKRMLIDCPADVRAAAGWPSPIWICGRRWPA